jgi:hypothetical protein
MGNLDSVLDFLLRHLEPTQASFRYRFEACLKDSLEICVSHDWHFAVTRRPPNLQQKVPVAPFEFKITGRNGFFQFS